MKAKSAKSGKDGLRGEYDFAPGQRGVYATRYAEGSNVVILQPDVAKVFATSGAVNSSLRRLIRQQNKTTAK